MENATRLRSQSDMSLTFDPYCGWLAAIDFQREFACWYVIGNANVDLTFQTLRRLLAFRLGLNVLDKSSSGRSGE